MRYILIAYPILEFWSLLQFSSWTSPFDTFSYLFFITVFGYWMLRAAGRSAIATFGRFRSPETIRGQLFASELSVAMAAILFMIPGLISDAVAIVFLIRAAFIFLGRWISGENRRQPSREDSIRSPDNDDGPVTLEGQYHRVDDD
jgi:UPF0716 protein FxsA